MFFFHRKQPSLTLGYQGRFPGDYTFFPFSYPLTLTGKSMNTHEHVMGVSGGGKSYYLAKRYVDLLTLGRAAALIDPHGDLAQDSLRLLIDRGWFKRTDAYQKFWYVDFTRKDRVVPFNILKTPYEHYTTARHVAEAFKRAYAANLSGEGAAPVFTDTCQFSALPLAANGRTIVEATRLLHDKAFREELLKRTDHLQTQEYFHLRYDRWDERDRTHKVESFLNKLSDLTIVDTIYYALACLENILDFHYLVDEGISVIFNIHVDDEETKRLLGCLLTVGFERAALTRKNIRTPYHLMIDEFASFSTADGKVLTTMLSQARKYGFYAILAHQTWDQLSDSLQSACQNMALEVFFGLGHEDAQFVAPQVGSFNPLDIKQTEVTTADRWLKTATQFTSMQEQWLQIAHKLENLNQQEAVVKIKTTLPRWKQALTKRIKIYTIRTATIPPQRCTDADIEQIKDYYAQTLLMPIEDVRTRVLAAASVEPVIKHRGSY